MFHYQSADIYFKNYAINLKKKSIFFPQFYFMDILERWFSTNQLISYSYFVYLKRLCQPYNLKFHYSKYTVCFFLQYLDLLVRWVLRNLQLILKWFKAISSLYPIFIVRFCLFEKSCQLLNFNFHYQGKIWKQFLFIDLLERWLFYDELIFDYQLSSLFNFHSYENYWPISLATL